jgi:N6-adenosine-specific RNA methylase IME4
MSAWPFDPLPMFGFDAVVMDSPARFETYSQKGEAKSPQAQYATMTDEEILALPVGDLVAGPGWCFLWTMAPKLDFGVDCLRAWGFRYVSTLAWIKVTVNDKVRMGPGYVVRTMHENVLIGAVGKPDYERALPSIFRGLAREHSRKPDEFYTLVDRFLPPHYRRADVFARQSRPGWTTWGNEATKFNEAAE